MAKSIKFDVMKNMGGLSGLNINSVNEDATANIDQRSNESPKSVEEKKKAVVPQEIKPDEEDWPEVKDSGSTPKKSIEREQQKDQEEMKLVSNILIPAAPKKNTKSRHKNFVMTEKRFNQFKELAAQRGQSENALFKDILTQIFGEE